MGAMRVTPILLSAEAPDGYRVHVVFADGTEADVDLADIVGSGPVFEAHRDPAFFRQLTVDSEANTIVWPNDTDIAPETLYAMARQEHDRLHEARA